MFLFYIYLYVHVVRSRKALWEIHTQKDHMYAERGPRVNHVNTLSIITLQNIVLDVRNESKK